MKEKFTPYLSRQFENPAIAEQYKILPNDIANHFERLDPLEEDSHQPVKGLVHKYENRALIKVSYRCAAHCRFCTRIRQIGTADGDLDSPNDIPNIIDYLRQHTEITDVILSGGDPFYTPKQSLELLNELDTIDSLKVIRIGTRLPIHNPQSFKAPLLHVMLNKVKEMAVKKPFIILLHFAHPDELTPEVLDVIRLLKTTGAMLLSQTVFLKGINDNYRVLKNLFENLYWAGVMPYYIYRCDYVKGLEHYVCDMADEIRIMTDLRRDLSGIAYPTYIVDVVGKGKIPVPLGFWSKTDITQCNDFSNSQVKIL
ncbi:MAG: kamA [Mucilaginibacter sp.]|nr:kamA [Mucilaginibacter sp.]